MNSIELYVKLNRLYQNVCVIDCDTKCVLYRHGPAWLIQHQRSLFEGKTWRWTRRVAEGQCYKYRKIKDE